MIASEPWILPNRVLNIAQQVLKIGLKFYCHQFRPKQYTRFSNMADRSSEFSFFQDTHITNAKRWDFHWYIKKRWKSKTFPSAASMVRLWVANKPWNFHYPEPLTLLPYPMENSESPAILRPAVGCWKTILKN